MGLFKSILSKWYSLQFFYINWNISALCHKYHSEYDIQWMIFFLTDSDVIKHMQLDKAFTRFVKAGVGKYNMNGSVMKQAYTAKTSLSRYNFVTDGTQQPWG